MKNRFLIIIMAIFAVLAGSCSSQSTQAVQETIPPKQSPTQTLITSTPTPTKVPLSVLESAQQVIQTLRDRDMAGLSTFVHPELGLRFSPYPFVRAEDLVFGKQSLHDLFSDETVYNWGNFDGSGEAIEMTFEAYFTRFVYSQDFAEPEVIGLNKEIGQGNSINNIPEFYPGADYVEYHFSGFDPQYAGMDWQSLRLVFILEGSNYYLIGIVHAQWTI